MGTTTISPPLPQTEQGPSLSVSINKEKVIQQLVHGQECATQLQFLFHKSSQQAQLELVQKILTSFNQTISVLSCSDSGEVISQQANSNYGDDGGRSEDSRESRRRPAPAKDRRGCYKRKRGSQTWKEVSATMEDGHAWRKYGQKEILNSKYPRSYFRCTRKYDQGCKATRQVQRVEDGSEMFQITYIGTHTCSASFKSLQIITDSAGSYWDSKTPTKQHLHPTTLLIKKEEPKTPSDLTESNSVIMWKDIIMSEPDIGMGSSNYVYSCDDITSQCFGLDFDRIKPACVEFDFDESELVV